MARNQEKAQSMLYRFREAQAAEFGLGTRKTEKRPRLASSVASLKECENWRAEVIREVSRKVSKIQDFGLTDYEVRDLNDEINKLIREKGHWETQILALGGANYKRGIPKMLDDSGQEVPGTRGYKYFGRAKDLPGVKELFEKTTEQQAQLESFRSQKYKRFRNLPCEYFGDRDEEDGILLQQEIEAEESLWKQEYSRVLEQLDVQEDSIPDIPRPKKPVPLNHPPTLVSDEASAKRKPDQNDQTETETLASKKRFKKQDGESIEAPSSQDSHQMDVDQDPQQQQPSQQEEQKSQTQPSQPPSTAITETFQQTYFTVFDQDELKMPRVPDRQETEKFILEAKKKALREEYIGSK